MATSMPGMMLQAQQAAQEKINRELFVGNTPPGTSEMLLMQFLNAAMRRVKLCQPHETPILNCRVNQKFAFVECASAELANQALNMNGIPFLGAVLRISRPSKYAGPQFSAKSWQQLTGQVLPVNVVLDASAEEKVNRELFIGNTTPEMTESMIRDFLGNAMIQVGLNLLPGNPITACRVSGKFAFIEVGSCHVRGCRSCRSLLLPFCSSCEVPKRQPTRSTSTIFHSWGLSCVSADHRNGADHLLPTAIGKIYWQSTCRGN